MIKHLPSSRLQYLGVFLSMLLYKCKAAAFDTLFPVSTTIVAATPLEFYACSNNVNVNQLRDILGTGILKGWITHELKKR